MSSRPSCSTSIFYTWLYQLVLAVYWNISTLDRLVMADENPCPSIRPFPCFNEQCCTPDHFCSSYSESCESCFPNGIQDTLTWCREIDLFNGSLYRNGACVGACLYRHRNNLFPTDINADIFQIDWIQVMVGVLVGVILSTLFLSPFLFWRKYQNWPFCSYHECSNENDDDEADYKDVDEEQQTTVMQPDPARRNRVPAQVTEGSSTTQLLCA